MKGCPAGANGERRAWGPVCAVGTVLAAGGTRPAPLLTAPMPDQLTEITQAARGYYAQAARTPITATDFFDWLRQLSAAEQAEFRAKGFAQARAERAFLRFALELRGVSMVQYMMEHLSVAAFDLWVAHAEFNGDLPDRFCRL